MDLTTHTLTPSLMVQRPIAVAPLVFIPALELGGVLVRQSVVGNSERWPLPAHQPAHATCLGATVSPVLALEASLPRRVFARIEGAMPIQLLKSVGPTNDVTTHTWKFTRHYRLMGGGGVHF